MKLERKAGTGTGSLGWSFTYCIGLEPGAAALAGPGAELSCSGQTAVPQFR